MATKLLGTFTSYKTTPSIELNPDRKKVEELSVSFICHGDSMHELAYKVSGVWKLSPEFPLEQWQLQASSIQGKNPTTHQ
jgi:hypothetical protein